MLTIGMTRTTIDIKDYKRVKCEAVNRDITVKELVNRTITDYLKKPHRKARC